MKAMSIHLWVAILIGVVNTQKQICCQTVNLVLPYVYPKFIKGASKRSIYNFSKVCIENAMDILGAIERVYLKEYHRNLTLGHLGEVFIVPRFPEKGQHMQYDINYKPTDYLKNDYEMLLRMEQMLF